MNPPSYLNTVQGVTQLYEVMSSVEIDIGIGGAKLNKWIYNVRPTTLQIFDRDAGPVKQNTFVDETYLTAYNVYETENDSETAMGIDVSLGELPGTFKLQPIPNGTVVPGWYYQGGDALVIFVAWPNQFDGTCTDETP